MGAAFFFFFFALCEISARNCKLKKKNLLMFKRLSLDKGKKKKKANVSLLMEGKRVVGAFQILEQKIVLFCRQYLCNSLKKKRGVVSDTFFFFLIYVG